MKSFIKMIEIFSLSNTNPEFIHLLGEELFYDYYKNEYIKNSKENTNNW